MRGPTSAANGASDLQVHRGSLVYDPFVGTGSIVVAAAYLGCQTCGADIDPRIIRGRDGRDLASNFVQYGLGVPECVLMDNANSCVAVRAARAAAKAAARRRSRSESFRCLRSVPLFDAIIADPPYGIRAGARRLGPRSGCERIERPAAVSDGAPPRCRQTTRVYEAVDVVMDLLSLAACTLVVGGRLVYLLPAARTFDVSGLPVRCTHPPCAGCCARVWRRGNTTCVIVVCTAACRFTRA